MNHKLATCLEHHENMIGELKRVDAEQVPQEVEPHSKETYAPALACHATEARDQDGDGDQEAAHVRTQASNMQVDQLEEESMQHAPAKATASATDTNNELEQTERQQYQRPQRAAAAPQEAYQQPHALARENAGHAVQDNKRKP